MEYNTLRSRLIIPEYGRNIHIMIDYAKTVADRDERNHVARSIVKVMGQVNSQYKESEDFIQKLWDHLFIISNFELDIDSPYPIPSKEQLEKKPKSMAYPNEKIKFKHYGSSIQKFIEKASAMEDGDEKDNFTYYIANMMKKNYLMYNRESVADELILKQLENISNGKLKLKEEFTLKSTNEIVGKSKPPSKNIKGKKNIKKNIKSRRK